MRQMISEQNAQTVTIDSLNRKVLALFKRHSPVHNRDLLMDNCSDRPKLLDQLMPIACCTNIRRLRSAKPPTVEPLVSTSGPKIKLAIRN